MAGRPRQPVDLLIARGKKHLTKAEIEQRRAQEVKMEADINSIQPPDYLPRQFHKEFNMLSEKLVALGIMTELDVDCLARYLLARQTYVTYTAMVMKAISEKDVEKSGTYLTMQDKVFRQCRACASDLGLTITSRCKLVIPTAPDDEDDEL